MQYLKLKNIPLKQLRTSRYGGDGKKIPWEACGFNAFLIGAKTVQFEDENGDTLQYLPISNLQLLEPKLILLNEDIEGLDMYGFEVVEEEYADLVILMKEWRARVKAL